jgi:hypothetical protein
VTIALPVMMARPRPRFRRRAGSGGDAGAVGDAGLGDTDFGGVNFGGVSRLPCPFFWPAVSSSRPAVSRFRSACSSAGVRCAGIS